MSRKRFATMIAVVLLLGGAGLLCLYITLGKMGEVLRSQGRPGASEVTTDSTGTDKIEQMTLTPAGEQQLREQQKQVQAAQKKDEPAAPPPPAPSTVPAPPAPAPSPGASGKDGA